MAFRGAQEATRGPQEGPIRAPRGPKTSPGRAQDGPKTAPSRLQVAFTNHLLSRPPPRSAHEASRAPKRPPRAPKRPPRGPQEIPKRLLDKEHLLWRSRALHLSPQIARSGGGGHSPSGVLDKKSVRFQATAVVYFMERSFYLANPINKKSSTNFLTSWRFAKRPNRRTGRLALQRTAGIIFHAILYIKQAWLSSNLLFLPTCKALLQ